MKFRIGKISAFYGLTDEFKEFDSYDELIKFVKEQGAYSVLIDLYD